MYLGVSFKIQKTPSSVLVYCDLGNKQVDNKMVVQITFDALKKLHLKEI